MPFDPIPYDAPVEDLSYATGDEGLLRLASLLEHQELWNGTIMRWNYQFMYIPDDDCGTAGCAIGLARAMWPEFAEGLPQPSLFEPSTLGEVVTRTRNVFELNQDGLDELFGSGPAKRRQKPMENVTPGEVAEDIRRFVSFRQPQERY